MNFAGKWSWWPNTSPDESAPIEPNDPKEVYAIKNMLAGTTPRAGSELAEPPKDPEPDLSTKPDDVVGYCFGYACPEKHVFGFFDSITLEGYNVRKPCQTCGGIGAPAVVRRIAEARWGDRSRPSMWIATPEPDLGWYNAYSLSFGKSTAPFGDPCWTAYEFVHYLDSPRPRRTRRKAE